jgi:hypothetical protein
LACKRVQRTTLIRYHIYRQNETQNETLSLLLYHITAAISLDSTNSHTGMRGYITHNHCQIDFVVVT